MTKILPILILVCLFVPYLAYAGFFGDVIDVIFCIFLGICADPCYQLISITEGGTAAFRLCRLVDRISAALYIIGWSLALVILIWGGIVYMTAGGNEEQIGKAKKIITNGLIGTAIVLSAGFVLSLLLEFLAPLFGY